MNTAGLAETALAEAFAQHARDWALAQGATPAVAAATAAAAGALSLATSAGHVCLELAELAELADRLDPSQPDGQYGEANDQAAWAASYPTARTAETAAALPVGAAAWRAALWASGLLGSPAEPGTKPMILDDEDRLYLHRDFDFERRLARRLARCAQAGPVADAMPTASAAAQLASLFGKTTSTTSATPSGATTDVTCDADPAAPDWQQLAAAMALRGRLTVISGGPGTGKTTTVVNLLACLLSQRPDSRIVLAAPTGKAAARLAEALGSRASHLPPALRERLPTTATTVHRLLGVRPPGQSQADPTGPFVHHAGQPLALDALVVDEASMLDLALATRLLEAVPDSARIILLGDKDQLSAVESGAVFAELSADPSLSDAARRELAALCGLAPEQIVPPAPLRPGALHDSVVWFKRNFRFAANSGIGRLAADTLAGRAVPALGWLRQGHESGVHWLDDGGPTPRADTLDNLMAAYQPYLATLQQQLASGTAPDAAAIHQAFGQFRVLCALREGPRGVLAINHTLALRLRQALGAAPGDARSAWFAGRPVMVLRNDPLLRLFNGDIGIALPDAGGQLQVFFPGPNNSQRAIAPTRLPAHETALAMTVHKSQGSEFDAVAVLLPAQRSRVLSRELLYTAVTRARSQVWLAASASVLAAAISQSTGRRSGLQARLREALGDVAG